MIEQHLLEVIPKNLAQSEVDYKVIEAIGNQEAKIFFKIDDSIIGGDLEKLSDEVLLHLLWENHLIKRSEGLALASSKKERANLIRSSIQLHRYKGTPYAIERALEAVNLEGNVEEWFEFDGDPYRFWVELSLNNKLNSMGLIEEMIMEYKNGRSWFDGFVILTLEKGIWCWDDSYSYPVYYKTCGEFSGEKNFNQSDVGDIALSNDTYGYKIEYPVVEKGFDQVDLKPIELKGDAYNYIKEFPVTGDMDPLTKEVTTLSGGASARAKSYEYNVTHPICGEFYAEGE